MTRRRGWGPHSRSFSSSASKNESGTVIATGTLDRGASDATYPTVVCHFSFTISNLPDAKFYSIEVTHRGALTYSQDQLNSDGWKVEASIGD